MRKHTDMLKKGELSIWIGNINPESELLSYVDDGRFGIDFEVDPRGRRELSSESEAVSPERLVHGFSSWRAFADVFVERVTSSGVVAAKSMVVFYAFEYVPTVKMNPNAPLTFVGVFDF